jgi:hypothetical protein
VRQPDKERRRVSRTPKKDYNFNNSILSKRKQKCVEIGKCMENVNLGTLVLMPMEKISFKRKPIYQAILKLRHAPSFIQRDIALTEKDVSFCILSMTLKSHLDI